MESSQGLLRRILSRSKGAGGRLAAGQPTHATHPELLAEGELTPGITASEYAARREALISSLPPSSVAVLPGAAGTFMTGHIPHPYRQDADFMFLTGVTQPQSIAVFGGHASQAPGFALFVPEPSEHDAKWSGVSIEAEAATELFGADEAFPMSQLERRLSEFVSGSHRVLYDADRNGGLLHMAVPALRRAVEQARVTPLRSALHSMRWRKSPAELRLMQQSATAAAEGLQHCMALTEPGVQEHRLAATFEYQCKMRGAQRMAYPSVVAGGPSATIIHYGNNDKVVRDGQLLLMDAGCERHGYASDVTRTWPVSGRFTPEQRAVYDVVLEMHRDCLQRCRLGTSLRDIHQHSIKLVSEGIADLRLLPGQLATSIARDAYREFYPHSLGHWLGMDTHDVASQSQDKLLQPGVVMTVEPGLYIPDEPQYGRFAGIGIRIEDDVAITEQGPEVLSRAVPTDPGQVEALVGSAAADMKRSFLRQSFS